MSQTKQELENTVIGTEAKILNSDMTPTPPPLNKIKTETDFFVGCLPIHKIDPVKIKIYFFFYIALFVEK